MYDKLPMLDKELGAKILRGTLLECLGWSTLPFYVSLLETTGTKRTQYYPGRTCSLSLFESEFTQDNSRMYSLGHVISQIKLPW